MRKWELLQMFKKGYFVSAISLVLLFIVIPRALSDITLKESSQVERVFGDYKVAIRKVRDEWGNFLFQIFKNDTLVFSDEAYEFELGQKSIWDGSMGEYVPHDLIGVGTDITDDGEPNLIMSSNAGGAHGPTTHYVFSIGDDFRIIKPAKGYVASWSHFKDFDGDGVLEFVAWDPNFEYWNCGRVNSSYGEVILAYEDGEYKVAHDFMEKPSPAPEEFEQRVTETKKAIADSLAGEGYLVHDFDGNFVLPFEGVSYMQDLIYSGNAKVAWDFYDRIWPDEIKGKEKYLIDFKEELIKSDYWQGIKEAYNYDIPIFSPELEGLNPER